MDTFAILFQLIFGLGMFFIGYYYQKQHNKEKKQDEYIYMVVYNVLNGTGRIKLKLKNKPTTFEEIEEMDKYIKDYTGLKEAFVIDYKLLS